MRILLLGSGGREHALAWKITQSNRLEKLFIAPGNAGTMSCGENIPLQVNDFTGIRNFVLERKINMLVVGPEDPLVNGIHDFFQTNPELAGIPVIGPGAAGARLEGSKDFAKQFMTRQGIPTAAYKTFSRDNLKEGILYLNSVTPPYVLKADGLAAGKGVIICNTREEAIQVLTSMIRDEKFGQASSKVVIEQFLSGIECSAFILTDGNSYLVLPEAKDYKKIGEGDRGPNTGGMGSVSPVPFADKDFLRKTEDKIIRPTVEGLKKEGIEYSGFIFFGLMNVKGDPYVIEYNCRMGDPEAESVIPRIRNDLLELFSGVASKTLHLQKIQLDPRYCATVMLVSKGYPEAYEKGKIISITGKPASSIVFHSGTRMNAGDNALLTNGGRVIAVTSFGKSMKKALETTYRNIEKIQFEGKYFRHDIGFDL